MLMVLGIETRSVYYEDFERPFLEESREFYMVNISVCLGEYIKSIQVYMCMYVEKNRN